MGVLKSLCFYLDDINQFTRHKRNDTIENEISKSIIMMQYKQSNY